MPISPEFNVYILLISTFFFYLAGFILRRRIVRMSLHLLTPVNVYLFSIGTSFLLMALYHYVPSKIILFLGIFAVTFGAAYIARLPLFLINPSKEKIIFRILLVTGFVLTFININQDIYQQLQYAHLYAFIVAGLFTIGYIIYRGIQQKNRKAKITSLSTGVSLGLCCVVSHGLIAFNIIPLVTIPFLQINNVELPIIFALSSAVTFTLVLFLTKYLK